MTGRPIAADTDVVVVGSGAAGMTAAIVAAAGGLRVVLLEKTEHVGGTTAWSGGVGWVPNNHLMPAAGRADTPGLARQYVAAIVGDRADGAMVDAFLASAPEAFEFLENNTSAVRWMSYPGVDYYPAHPGASSHRGLMVKPYDGRELGEHLAELQYPLRQLVLFGSMQVDVTDIYHLQRMLGSWKSFTHSARLLARYSRDRLSQRRGTRLIRGNALAARLYRSVLDLGVTVLRNSEVVELVRKEHRVTGVVYARRGERVTVQAARGVVLAAGGVSASMRFRKMLMPHAARHVSMLPDGNSGDGVSLALAHGAVLGPDKPKNGCLTPVSVLKRVNGDVVKYPHLAFDRCKPGSIMVDAAGRRFTNEAACYHDVVTAMHAVDAVPAWLIGDRPFQRRYGMGLARPFPYPVRPLVQDGYLLEAASVAELARKIKASPEVLAETIARFNEIARTGVDTDFGRGGNAYDRSLGDAEHSPNSSLGEIRCAPFYALKLYPGDVGTFRGLRVNTNAQVTDAQGKVFEGLYACGLDMDSIFGGFYPGAGAMHGPNITFAYVAGRHLAGQDVSREPDALAVQAAS